MILGGDFLGEKYERENKEIAESDGYPVGVGYVVKSITRSERYNFEEFDFYSDPIDFLLKNKFRVEWEYFAKKEIDSKEIKKIQEAMPRNSQLHLELKKVADKEIYPNGSSRGVHYDYLVKVVAGFSLAWSETNDKN